MEALGKGLGGNRGIYIYICIYRGLRKGLIYTCVREGLGFRVLPHLILGYWTVSADFQEVSINSNNASWSSGFGEVPLCLTIHAQFKHMRYRKVLSLRSLPAPPATSINMS